MIKYNQTQTWFLSCDNLIYFKGMDNNMHIQVKVNFNIMSKFQ